MKLVTFLRLLGWLLFLLAAWCLMHVGYSATVDQSQIYTTGDTEFRWVLTPDYGYLPIDTNGDIVSGLSQAGTVVWLVDDSQHVDIAAPPCCGPTPPPPAEPTMVTPEPKPLLLVGGFLIGWSIAFWYGSRRRK